MIINILNNSNPFKKMQILTPFFGKKGQKTTLAPSNGLHRISSGLRRSPSKLNFYGILIPAKRLYVESSTSHALCSRSPNVPAEFKRFTDLYFALPNFQHRLRPKLLISSAQHDKIGFALVSARHKITKEENVAIACQ